jgi:hypothetical protein
MSSQRVCALITARRGRGSANLTLPHSAKSKAKGRSPVGPRPNSRLFYFRRFLRALFGHVMSWGEDLETRREKFDSDADKGLASEYAAAFSETWQRYLQRARRFSG